MQHVKDILAGLAVFVVVAGTIGGLLAWGIYSSSRNNDKVREMTKLCTSLNYRGWSDNSNSGSNGVGTSVCTN